MRIMIITIMCTIRRIVLSCTVGRASVSVPIEIDQLVVVVVNDDLYQ